MNWSRGPLFADDINGTDAEEALIKIGHIFKCFLAAFFSVLGSKLTFEKTSLPDSVTCVRK